MRSWRIAAVFAFAALLGARASAQSPTLVFLVRHAEKAAQPANDPPLTPAGEIRARVLVDVLAHAGIGYVISTPVARTTATARPLAEKLGLRIDTIGTGGGLPAHARAVADAVRKHAGQSVLVVGHSNTIPAIVAALGGPTFPDLCDGDYDQLFTLELPASGAPRLARSRFGAVAADTACAKMSSGRSPTPASLIRTR
jgi:broad specificity phosphatase PhoE